MNREALQKLRNDDLIALILAQSDVISKQSEQLALLQKRVEALEAKLGKPPKTPDNSSIPPSQGQKPNRAERRAAQRKGRPGVTRALAENPDRVIEARAEACPHCAHGLTAADQQDFHAYDHIDLPPIRPVVTRIHRHRGACPCCARTFQAPVPEGLEPGSPFGPGIAALILHLHITQAIGFERLVKLMDEVFGIVLSEGAVANMLARAEAPMIVAAEKIAEEVRAAKVVTDFLQGAKPEVWIADRYGAQNGHALERQLCLAHLLRDAQYAIDEGDTVFAPAFKALLLRAIAIGRRRESLKDSTLAQYRADLERRLTNLLQLDPTTAAGRKLVKGVKKCRNDLFLFVVRRDVPYTNNGSERALRPSVIFRKVTGCFRSHWGARLYAAAVSVIATGRLRGKSALHAIQDVIAPKPEPYPA